jgi:hypothetical protein
MSADQPQPTGPATPPPAPEPEKKKSGGASLGALIGIGIAVVLLSFLASFLGARFAQSSETASEPTPTPLSSAEYVAAIEEILPAGSAVRAGTGVPEAGKGYEGDVYIDLATSDVYVFRDGNWVLAGNIRQNAAENLTGETGPPGETGASGAPGAPGTQLLLGTGEPANDTCTVDGDIYLDTAAWLFYQCGAGTWTQFGPPPAADEQSPSPSPSESDDD